MIKPEPTQLSPPFRAGFLGLAVVGATMIAAVPVSALARNNASGSAPPSSLIDGSQWLGSYEASSNYKLSGNLSREHSIQQALDDTRSLQELVRVRSDWVAQNETSNFVKMTKRIDYLAAQPADWKGPGSVPATEVVASDSKILLFKLSRAEMTPPFIGLDADGDLTFAWNNNHFVCDMSIYGDGTYSFFAKSERGEASADEAKIDEPLPSSLLEVFP